jgi:hypothetical protein
MTTHTQVVLYLTTFTIGLALGWVAGSAAPWAWPALVIALAIGGAWIAYSVITARRIAGEDWATHAETAKRLLDETEADETDG